MKAPAFDRYRLTLRLTAPARFHFLHGAVVRGLLSRALADHDLPEGVIPATPESGRTVYQAGEAYHLGITFVGEDRAAAPRLLAGLARLGQTTPDGQRSPTLGGNFHLEAAEPAAPPDLDAEAAALAATAGGATTTTAGTTATLQLLSPLRLERPSELKVRGAAYLNDDCFPAAHFLDRLAARLVRLGGSGLGPAPPMPSATTAAPAGLTWLDLPVPGAPGKGRSYTLGGVLGRVRIADLPPEWLPWLVLGRHLHVGASTGFGFGRYRILETEPARPEPFLPARGALHRAAVHQRLEEALDHVLESSDAAGEDGVAPDDFARGSERRLGEIAHQLATGRYRPSALTGFLVRKPSGGLRPLAVPTVRDRVAQRAVGQVLAEAVDTLLEDCSYAYRKGFSRAGAARALERAYAQGYRYVLDADVHAFFDAVDHDRLFAKLDALWPLDPVVELLRQWVRAPVVFDGRTLTRDRGLPQGAAISPLLANLFLDELDEEVLGAGYRLVRYADDFVVLARDLEEAKRARADSWLAQVPFARLRTLVADAGSPRRKRRPVRVVPLGQGQRPSVG